MTEIKLKVERETGGRKLGEGVITCGENLSNRGEREVREVKLIKT